MLLLIAAVMVCRGPLAEAQTKPNILVIMGDDIGYWNLSTYNQGMMGYRTPNIDSIANEGRLGRRARAKARRHAGGRACARSAMRNLFDMLS